MYLLATRARSVITRALLFFFFFININRTRSPTVRMFRCTNNARNILLNTTIAAASREIPSKQHCYKIYDMQGNEWAGTAYIVYVPVQSVTEIWVVFFAYARQILLIYLVDVVIIIWLRRAKGFRRSYFVFKTSLGGTMQHAYHEFE